MPRATARGGLVIAGVVWLAVAAAPARAQGQPRHVKATLVAETAGVQPGRPLQLGVRLEMEEGWHTYWQNPGDSGLPTRVKWELPQGFSAGEMRWPYPSRFATGPIVSYGYEHEVLLPVTIRVPPAVASREVRFVARVSWLECQEACLPGKAELVLVLPIVPEAREGPLQPLFVQARNNLPAAEPGWRVSAEGGTRTVSLAVRPPPGTAIRDAYFYPLTPRLVDYSKPQSLRRGNGALRLELARDPNGVSAERLAGVLVAGTSAGTTALDVDVKLVSAPARTSIEKERKP
jgi:DsbC/DsbD-like thiol-disulfide interchange protein